MLAALPVLSCGELALLFHGDDWSEGYPTFELALAICEQAEPQSVMELYRAVYHTSSKDTLRELEETAGERAAELLLQAFQFWHQRQRLAA